MTGLVGLDTCGRRHPGTSRARRPIEGGLIIAFLRPREDLHTLTDVEARVVRRLAEAAFPSGGALAAGAAEASVVEALDRFLTHVPRRERVLIRAMFLLFRLDFAIFDAEGGLESASNERIARCLRGWETSRLYPRRLAFQAFRSTLLLAYLGNPDVRRELGVRPGEDELGPTHLRAVADELLEARKA